MNVKKTVFGFLQQKQNAWFGRSDLSRKFRSDAAARSSDQHNLPADNLGDFLQIRRQLLALQQVFYLDTAKVMLRHSPVDDLRQSRQGTDGQIGLAASCKNPAHFGTCRAGKT